MCQWKHSEDARKAREDIGGWTDVRVRRTVCSHQGCEDGLYLVFGHDAACHESLEEGAMHVVVTFFR
jgi:hypothetical protein